MALRRSLRFMLVACALTIARPASAEPHLEARGSAREHGNAGAEHFERAVRRFNEGDNAGALLHFLRAYELVHEPFVLYNIGLVQVELNRPVEAVTALDEVLKNSVNLPPERVERARRVRDEQASRLAYLTITTNVPSQIEIDNIVVGKTPLTEPLRVASGSRLLALIAVGHAPIRREVQLSPGSAQTEAVELVPIPGVLAQVNVRSQLPGADVLLDENLVGRTPLPGSVPVAPGLHKVSLRRSGYREALQEVSLADGATLEVALEPAEAPEAEGLAGTVRVAVSEHDATVLIDGKVRPEYRAGVRLVAGVHRMIVTRTGFFTVERDIVSQAGVTKEVHVALEPSEETRVAHVALAKRQRRRGWVTAAVGALVTGTFGYLIAHNERESDRADAEHARVAASLTPGGKCDARTEQDPACQGEVDHANGRVDAAERMRWIAISGAALGGVALVTGVVLLLTAQDPKRYDPERPKRDEEERLFFVADAQKGGARLGIMGRF